MQEARSLGSGSAGEAFDGPVQEPAEGFGAAEGGGAKEGRQGGRGRKQVERELEGGHQAPGFLALAKASAWAIWAWAMPAMDGLGECIRETASRMVRSRAAWCLAAPSWGAFGEVMAGPLESVSKVQL